MITSSQITIVNYALALIGCRPIISMLDDIEEARIANAVWDMDLETELCDWVWRFALRRAAIPREPAAPAFGFKYQYPLPPDCLRVIQVDRGYRVQRADYITRDDSFYSIEDNKILTNIESPLQIRYITKVNDTTQFGSSFQRVISYRLARTMAIKLKNDPRLLQALQAGYDEALNNAISNGALETAQSSIPDQDFMLDRLIV